MITKENRVVPTPGPWIVSRHEDNNDVIIRDKSEAIIANCTVDTVRDYGMTDDQHDAINIANAKLMSIAPELLMHLNALTYCFSDDSNDYPDSSMFRQVQDQIKAARKVIAKATGV